MRAILLFSIAFLNHISCQWSAMRPLPQFNAMESERQFDYERNVEINAGANSGKGHSLSSPLNARTFNSKKAAQFFEGGENAFQTSQLTALPNSHVSNWFSSGAQAEHTNDQSGTTSAGIGVAGLNVDGAGGIAFVRTADGALTQAQGIGLFGQQDSLFARPAHLGRSFSDSSAAFTSSGGATNDMSQREALRAKDKWLDQFKRLNDYNANDENKFGFRDATSIGNTLRTDVETDQTLRFTNKQTIEPIIKETAISIPITKPVFYAKTRKVPVPITVAQPVITTVSKPVYYKVNLERPIISSMVKSVPYKVPIYRPKAIPIETDVPIPHIVRRPFKYPVSRPVPVPHYVDKPIPVPVIKPIRYPVTNYKPVIVPVDKEVQIHIPRYKPVPVIVNKNVPIPIQKITKIPVVYTKNVYVPTEKVNQIPVAINKYVATPVQVLRKVLVPVVKSVPVHYPVYQKVAVPVKRQIPYQVPVIERVPVPIIQRVPFYQITKKPVSVPIEQNVPVPVPVIRHQPVPVPQYVKSYYPVNTPVLVPYERKVPVPVGIDRVVPIPYERPIDMKAAMLRAEQIQSSRFDIPMQQKSMNIAPIVQLGQMQPFAQSVLARPTQIGTIIRPVYGAAMMSAQQPHFIQAQQPHFIQAQQPHFIQAAHKPRLIHAQQVKQQETEIEVEHSKEIEADSMGSMHLGIASPHSTATILPSMPMDTQASFTHGFNAGQNEMMHPMLSTNQNNAAYGLNAGAPTFIPPMSSQLQLANQMHNKEQELEIDRELSMDQFNEQAALAFQNMRFKRDVPMNNATHVTEKEN